MPEDGADPRDPPHAKDESPRAALKARDMAPVEEARGAAARASGRFVQKLRQRGPRPVARISTASPLVEGPGGKRIERQATSMFTTTETRR